VLILCLVVLAVEAWYPFDVELPLWHASEPARTETGVRFDGDGDILASGGGGPWLAEAARTGRLTVELEARAADVDQQGPARLLAISRSHYRANLVIGQDGDDLVVRLRRPESDRSGDPPYRVPDVFADDEWRRLTVTLHEGQAQVAVDGVVRREDGIGPELLTDWDVTHRLALGDDVAGERSWAGELRRAELTAGDGAPVDLLEAGELEATGGWRLRNRVRALRGSGSDDPLLLSILRIIVFVPVGAALRRILRHAVPAGVAVALAAATLTVGKAFVAGRHPALVDAVLSTLGGLAGVALVDVQMRRRRRLAGPPDDDGPGGGGGGSPAAPPPSADAARAGSSGGAPAPAPADPVPTRGPGTSGIGRVRHTGP
jgi:hypothetical protein